MGNINFPENSAEFISIIYSIVRLSLTSKAKGFTNLSQSTYLIQWTHSVFKLHDIYAGQIFTEKYLFYLKAEKYQQEDNLANLEYLCSDARCFVEKTRQQGLWQPSHSKMLANLYRIAGHAYLKHQKRDKAIGILEDAERTLILLLKECPTYTKAQVVLNSIRADLKTLYS